MPAAVPFIPLPVSLDADRARESFVISDAENNVVALVPGDLDDPTDDAEARAIAEQLVATINARARTYTLPEAEKLTLTEALRVAARYYATAARTYANTAYQQQADAAEKLVTLLEAAETITATEPE